MTRTARVAVFLLVAAGPMAVVLAPLLIFALNSFYGMSDGQIIYQLSLDNYMLVVRKWDYLGVLMSTIRLCATVALICVLIGYPIAWYVWRQETSRRFPLLMVITMPLFMSYIVKLFTMRSMLSVKGLVNDILMGTGILREPTNTLMFNETAILVIMVILYLPFVILPIYLALERIPTSIVQASSDLGGTPGDTFRHITWPLSIPGIISGAMFAFVLSVGDYVTPTLVGGPNGFTFGRIIFSQFGAAYNWPLGAAMATILLAISAIVLVTGAAISRRYEVR